MLKTRKYIIQNNLYHSGIQLNKKGHDFQNNIQQNKDKYRNIYLRKFAAGFFALSQSVQSVIKRLLRGCRDHFSGFVNFF